MINELQIAPTELQIAFAIKEAEPVIALIIRRLAFQRDRYQSCLQQISEHSVCCDARHMADEALKNGQLL